MFWLRNRKKTSQYFPCVTTCVTESSESEINDETVFEV